MKKTYIAPKTKAFQVHVQGMLLAESLGFGGTGSGEINEVETKEEKNSGGGIWDLYK